MPKPVNKIPELSDGEYKVEKVIELSFFDLTGSKAGTQGTSNKSYHAELQLSSKDNKAQIFTMWGPTGGTQTKEWRYYPNSSEAEKDFSAIIKSKTKKGYVEVDIAQRAYGSDAAKQITKAVTLTNAPVIVSPKSSLDPETQKLISHLFGATSQFVATTLKCPLGQLTNKQIDEGRARLNDAKAVLNNSIKLSSKDKTKLEELTNDFYALIPHNLGSGSRGQMTQLLLDDLNKIIAKEQDLDTLLDAKSVGAVLNQNNDIDEQYKQLNSDLIHINSSDPIFQFMSSFFEKSKVRNHGYEKSKVKHLWGLDRKDAEKDYFLKNTNKIAKEYGKHTFIQEASSINKNAKLWIPNNRPDLTKELQDLYTKANTWLCWHGTRTANLIGISRRGILIRPAGAVHTGSALGDAKYFAWQSTKSLNYTDGGYWTGGKTRNTSRFMFLLDVSFGNMYQANKTHFYKKPPIGYHSVYGKAGHLFLNDEMTTYDHAPESTQSRIRYLLEITD